MLTDVATGGVVLGHGVRDYSASLDDIEAYLNR